MRFYAPFSGVIGAFKSKEGAQVTEGTALVTIYDPHSLIVEIDIPCTHHNAIAVNQPIYIFNRLYHLNHVQKMVDDETHMCPADAEIQCPDCLVGTNVRGRLVVNTKTNVLVIPAQALFLKQGTPHVYKVVHKKIELVAVKTGLEEKENIEIISGLKAGDQIVSRNPERVYPGMDVSIYPG